MAIDWLTVRADPIEAAEHGVEATDTFETLYIGPRTADRISYPAAEVLPQATERTSGNEFQHTLFTNLYFNRSRGLDYIDEVLHVIADVITETLAAFARTETAISYVPASIEDYAGELDDTLVLLVSIRWEVTTTVELADTDR
jgi:hypothetical protein